MSDGLEAIQRTEELRPDLILLDIGLPKLNGIDVARRIRRLAPECKIAFLSQNSSVQLVQAALSTGAVGYVYKMDASSDLMLAFEAALQNKQFVSRSLKGYQYGDTPAS